VARNGLEVLEALRRQQYDVVLMDLGMAELDGLETSRLIGREWPEEQRPYLIAMAASEIKGDRIDCLEAGLEGYLSKPIKIQELRAALRAAASGRSSGSGS